MPAAPPAGCDRELCSEAETAAQGSISRRRGCSAVSRAERDGDRLGRAGRAVEAAGRMRAGIRRFGSRFRG